MPRAEGQDGFQVSYHVWGRRDGSPVCMIQGLGTDARGWALQRGAFGRRHRCVAPDNRGTGGSAAAPLPYDLRQMADDVVRILDAEGIERAHVMGASMGGVIAQIVGVLHPDRTRSLVLACTACRHHHWRRELLEDWAALVRAQGMSALGEDALSWLVGHRLHKRFGLWLNVLARVVLQQPAERFAGQIDAILDAPDELRAELHGITVPTLVITGSQDALTPVGDAEEIAELVPGARLAVLTGAAHGLMAEAPNAYNSEVLAFLAEVDGTPGRPPGVTKSASPGR